MLPLGRFLAVPVLAVSSAQGAKPADQPPRPEVVKVTIELNKTVEPISLVSKNIFKITITNTAAFTLYIYKDLQFGITVFLKDKNHHSLKPRVVGDLCPPPPPKPGESVYLPIEPLQSVSLVYDRSPDELGVKRPGKYFATGYYFRYLTRDPDHTHPSLREIPLKSNTIEFTVK